MTREFLTEKEFSDEKLMDELKKERVKSVDLLNVLILAEDVMAGCPPLDETALYQRVKEATEKYVSEGI